MTEEVLAIVLTVLMSVSIIAFFIVLVLIIEILEEDENEK
jgi:hypothetical protein